MGDRFHRTLNSLYGTVLLVIVVAAYSGGAAPDPAPAPAPGPAPGGGGAKGAEAPALLSGPEQYDGQPALAAGPGDEAWCAWVAYGGARGDQILARRRSVGGTWGEVEAAVPGPGQFVRPTLACAGGAVHLFWTASDEKALASVWHSRRDQGGWSKPEAISDRARASQNQEVAVGQDGKLAVVWQEWGGDATTGPRYDICLRTLAPDGWGDARRLAATGDNWDPAIGASPDGAHLWVAWTTYINDDYDLVVGELADGAVPKLRPLGTRGAYDLHPSLAVEGGGAVWVAWDEIYIKAHGRSGRSTITGANLAGVPEGNQERRKGESHLRLARLTADETTWFDTEAVVPPRPHTLAHAGLPKVVMDGRGHPCILYRGLTQKWGGEAEAGGGAGGRAGGGAGGGRAGQGRGGGGGGGGKTYWWDCFAQTLTDGWSSPVQLGESDGTLEEMAAVRCADGILAAWSMEHRREQGPIVAPRKQVVEADHHGDYDKAIGRDGDIYAVALPAARGKAAAEGAARTKPPADHAVEPRVARARAAHELKVGDKTYHLLWGDFHKHSNISRCSSGNEPGPDDHYRYAQDVCRYDFLAMTDHSEHTSPYNWWRLQKLADLYQVPGAFVPLYGYEWSARWPIGHHNVIFRGKPDPILRSNVAGARDTPELWKSLAGVKALTIPHTSADPRMGTDFKNHDPEFERVLEIFQSCRGSYEYDGCPRQHAQATANGGFYWDALAEGRRMGIICSSDHGFGTAYVAAYAEEDSRESVFDAVWARRCYGSTAYGLVVDVRVDGHPMGAEFAADAPPSFEIYVRGGSAPIRSVEVLGRGDIVYHQGSQKKPLGQREAHLTWRETEDRHGETWYYVRVIQEDDEMAWTSPVWVTRK